MSTGSAVAPRPGDRSSSPVRDVIRNRGFRRLWVIGGSSMAMRWLDTVAVGAFVLQLTDSPFDVALTFFFRMIPMFALGAYIGAVSDRLNRRLILIAAYSLMATVYLVLATAVILDVIEVWHIYIGALLAGVVWATDFPVRRAMIGEVVPPERLSTAMGLDMATSNFMRIPGPFLGGLLLQTLGMGAVYLVGASLFLIGAATAFSLEYRPQVAIGPVVSPLRNIAAGIRYIRTDTIILTVLAITIIMNMFAFPYQSMVPVIADGTFGVSSTLLGVLVSAEGAGATLGALLVASRAKPAQYTRIYFWGSILLLVMLFAFSRVPWYAIAIPVLFVAGFGMSGFGTMQSILIISTTPPAMRGRVLGVLAVTIGTGPVAALAMGAMAEAIGAPGAILVFALTGLVLMGLTLVLSRPFLNLRDARTLEERGITGEPASRIAPLGEEKHQEDRGQDDHPDDQAGRQTPTPTPSVPIAHGTPPVVGQPESPLNVSEADVDPSAPGSRQRRS